MLFRLLSDTADRSFVEEAVEALHEQLPDADYLAGSTGGNICDGQYVHGPRPTLTVICSVFEDPDTRFEVHQFTLNEEHREETCAGLLRLIDERPWVKAIEMLTTIIDVSMADFRADISCMREDIEIFGGGVLSSENVDMFTGLPFVRSSAGDPSGHATAFVLYGGDNFHVKTQTIFGWKAFGLPLEITRAEGPVLYELDGEPAFDRYHHYLSIENDEHFTQNALIFPLMIEYEGRSALKDPLKVGENGSLYMTSDLAAFHKWCRIAYGDPSTILDSIKESAIVMQGFSPQGILAFSCAARLMYWGADGVSYETHPFQDIAPTAGFYTGGEFARDKGRVLHHNVTLVVAGMREGDSLAVPEDDVEVNAGEFSRQMAIVHSLAAFIGVVSEELREAYDRMEVIAKTDGLTEVWNRREIESLIERAIEVRTEAQGARGVAVVMLDIDDFKKVNDAYGHKAGDDVLRGLGALLLRIADELPSGHAGRWGGEEFMLLFEGTLDDAVEVGQRICDEFAATAFPLSGRHTISVGVAQARDGEAVDSLCQRVDAALYEAKEQGKNRVAVAR